MADLSPLDLQFLTDILQEDSPLMCNPRPKDSDRRLKDEEFIYVPDCTEAYIVTKTLAIVRAAFSSDCWTPVSLVCSSDGGTLGVCW